MAAVQRIDVHLASVALERRMFAVMDLNLAMKNLSWEFAGPDFTREHDLLQPQVRGVGAMVSDSARLLAVLPRPMMVASMPTAEWCIPEAVPAVLPPGAFGDLEGVFGALVLRYRQVVAGHGRAIRCLAGRDATTGALLHDQSQALSRYAQLLRGHLRGPGMWPAIAA